MINYNKLKLNKKGQVTLKSLMDFLLYCNSEERWDAFCEIANGELASEYPMSWKTFYKGLQFAYDSGKAAPSEAISIKNLIEKKNHDTNGCWLESFFRAWAEFRNDYLLTKNVSFDAYFETMKARLKQTEVPYASSKKTSWKTWFLAVAAYI